MLERTGADLQVFRAQFTSQIETMHSKLDNLEERIGSLERRIQSYFISIQNSQEKESNQN